MVRTFQFGGDPEQEFAHIDLTEENNKAVEQSWLQINQMKEIGFSQKQIAPIYTSRTLNRVMAASQGSLHKEITNARDKAIKASRTLENEATQEKADIAFMHKSLTDPESPITRIISNIDPQYRQGAENTFFWLDTDTQFGVNFVNFASILQVYTWQMYKESKDQNGDPSEEFLANVESLAVNTPSLLMGDYTGNQAALWDTFTSDMHLRMINRIFLEENFLEAPHANQVQWLHFLDEVLIAPKKFSAAFDRYSAGELDDYVIKAINIILVAGYPVSNVLEKKWMQPFILKWLEKHKDTTIVTHLDSVFWIKIKELFKSDLKTPAWIKHYKPKAEKKKRTPKEQARKVRSKAKKASTPPNTEEKSSIPNPEPAIEKPITKTLPLEIDAEALWIDLDDGGHQFKIPKVEPGFTVFIRVAVVRNGISNYEKGFGWRAYEAEENCDLSTIYGGQIQVEMIAATSAPDEQTDISNAVKLETYKHIREPEKRKATKSVSPRKKQDKPISDDTTPPEKTDPTIAELAWQEECLLPALFDHIDDWSGAFSDYQISEKEITLTLQPQLGISIDHQALDQIIIQSSPVKLLQPAHLKLEGTLKELFVSIIAWINTEEDRKVSDTLNRDKEAQDIERAATLKRFAPLMKLGKKFKVSNFELSNGRGFVWDKILRNPDFKVVLPELKIELQTNPAFGITEFKINGSDFVVQMNFPKGKKNQKDEKQFTHKVTPPGVTVSPDDECLLTKEALAHVSYGALFSFALQLDPEAIETVDPVGQNKKREAEKLAKEKEEEEIKRQNILKSSRGVSLRKNAKESLNRGDRVRVLLGNTEGDEQQDLLRREHISADQTQNNSKIILVSGKLMTIGRGYEKIEDEIQHPYYRHCVYRRLRATVKTKHGQNGETREPFENPYQDLVFQAMAKLKISEDRVLKDKSTNVDECDPEILKMEGNDLVSKFLELVKQNNLPASFHKAIWATRTEIESIE